MIEMFLKTRGAQMKQALGVQKARSMPGGERVNPRKDNCTKQAGKGVVYLEERAILVAMCIRACMCTPGSRGVGKGVEGTEGEK